jgi:hypothetical protein
MRERVRVDARDRVDLDHPHDVDPKAFADDVRSTLKS